MQITLELVGFQCMVWVLGITSLTLVVQYSMQYHQSTISRLTCQSCSMVKLLINSGNNCVPRNGGLDDSVLRTLWVCVHVAWLNTLPVAPN